MNKSDYFEQQQFLWKVEEQEVKVPFKNILPFFSSKDIFVRIGFLETLYLYPKYEKICY